MWLVVIRPTLSRTLSAYLPLSTSPLCTFSVSFLLHIRMKILRCVSFSPSCFFFVNVSPCPFTLIYLTSFLSARSLCSFLIRLFWTKHPLFIRNMTRYSVRWWRPKVSLPTSTKRNERWNAESSMRICVNTYAGCRRY